MYGIGSPNGTSHGNGMSGAPVEGPKASQACMTCRKQKRKCNKTLPACGLCERMNRHCDYSDGTPPPTTDDFNALRNKLVELESRFNGGGGGGGGGGMSPPTPSFTSPSSAALSEALGGGSHLPPYNPQQQQQETPYQWHGVQNKFPAIAFLDKESFTYGGHDKIILEC